MARTIQEIDITRQRVGGCEISGKVSVEEPVGAPHDAIVAAEAAAIAREIESAITAVITSRAATAPPATDIINAGAFESLLKQ
jgi:hypothetical protein